MWQREFSVLTSASAAAIWKLFRDVEGWTAWNAGIEDILIDGPFAVGTEFEMKPPDQPPLTSRLVKVQENVGFEDETVVGEVRVLVDHRIEQLDATQVRITYVATVTGPGAAEVGAAVTEDFPAVLQALASLAERT